MFSEYILFVLRAQIKNKLLIYYIYVCYILLE